MFACCLCPCWFYSPRLDAGFARHNSQPNQHQNVPILARRNSAPHDFASRSDHVDISVATSSAFLHSDVPLHSARMGSFTETQYYRKNSKSECHECDHSAVQSLSDCTASISEVRHCNEKSQHGYPTFVLPRVAIGMPAEDDDAASVASTAAVERRSFQTEPNSHFRPAADLSSSMRFSPTADDITNSPASASSFSSSSPNESAIDLSRAKVNLNARHFCGKRRDRMRPMKRRQSIT
ncbi:hypothetical protein HJC23_003514 [Cyclotella cryptica]|uniref:Uncharacterized protein n=1 Tax=Cyclotella cryptica TaxID=29204 RepID=A0ABD3PAL9_9STRA